jgi:hypothetical protein
MMNRALAYSGLLMLGTVFTAGCQRGLQSDERVAVRPSHAERVKLSQSRNPRPLRPKRSGSEAAEAQSPERIKSALIAQNTKVAPPVPLVKHPPDDLFNAALTKQKAIYGTDDRVEIGGVMDDAAFENGERVVALFQSSDVHDNGDGTSTLKTVPFALAYNLCNDEPFRSQPIGAYCTGFLVAPNLIATAGHCAGTSELPAESIRAVFGYRMGVDGAVTRVPNQDVYAGAEIVGRKLNDNTGEDWAVVKLEREVINRTPARLRRDGGVPDNVGLYVIGHPCGLPAKYAGGATVRDNSNSLFFISNLDTYGGNSGSPVFSSVTHEVEGILVRGETDFVPVADCNRSLVCPNNGCSGESCTRVARFVSLIPPASP